MILDQPDIINGNDKVIGTYDNICKKENMQWGY